MEENISMTTVIYTPYKILGGDKSYTLTINMNKKERLILRVCLWNLWHTMLALQPITISRFPHAKINIEYTESVIKCVFLSLILSFFHQVKLTFWHQFSTQNLLSLKSSPHQISPTIKNVSKFLILYI